MAHLTAASCFAHLDQVQRRLVWFCDYCFIQAIGHRRKHLQHGLERAKRILIFFTLFEMISNRPSGMSHWCCSFSSTDAALLPYFITDVKESSGSNIETYLLFESGRCLDKEKQFSMTRDNGELLHHNKQNIHPIIYDISFLLQIFFVLRLPVAIMVFQATASN